MLNGAGRAMVKMGSVWDRTIEFLGDHLSTLLPIVILALFVPTSIEGGVGDLRQGAAPHLKVVLDLMQIAFGLLSLWAQLAVTALAIDPALGRRITGVATARLLPAIGIYLALGVALFVLLMPGIVLMAVGGGDLAAMRDGQMAVPSVMSGYLVGAVLYIFAVMVALLFVVARLLPLSAVIVAERRGLGAVTRAFSMTRGLTWRLVGVILLYAVVASVTTMAAQTVFGSILRIFADGDGPVSVAGIVTAVIVATVSTGFTVLGAAFAAKLYVAIQRETASAPAVLVEDAAFS